MRDMRKFLAVLVTWLMVLVALAQGGPGGSGGPGSGGGSGSGGGQPTLSPQFQLNDWMTNEPATDKNHFPDQLPAIEGNTVTVVYDKGGSAQVQLFFRNNNPNQNFTGQLIVEDARYIHDAAPLPVPWGSPPPVTIPDTILSAPTVSLNIASLATAPATLTISGLPAFVTKGHIQLQMRAEGNFGAQVAGSESLVPWSGGLSSQKVLITYAPPTGFMNPVWTEVAEMSCTMAQGEAGLTDVNRNLTKGLYYANFFSYNLGMLYVPSVWIDLDTGMYDLTGLLVANAANGSAPVPGNCWDVNSFLMFLHDSQGIDTEGQRTVLGPNEGPFVTNYFCPIGSDPTDSALHLRVKFISHFQCVVQGNVSDAALGYWNDLSGGIHKNPAWGWPNLPSWQAIDGSSAYGLTFRRWLTGDLEQTHPYHPFNEVIILVNTPIDEPRIAQVMSVAGVE